MSSSRIQTKLLHGRVMLAMRPGPVSTNDLLERFGQITGTLTVLHRRGLLTKSFNSEGEPGYALTEAGRKGLMCRRDIERFGVIPRYVDGQRGQELHA